MDERKRLRRPAPGTVLGALALIVAIGGNANAFSSTHLIVRRGDIAKGAVTAKALAKGSVTSGKIAKGAVGAKALGAAAVTPPAIANDAVTASAIAPGSVYGGALGPVTLHTAAIKDLDESLAPGTWTASESPTALCGPGERLLSGGVVFSNPGNREVGIIEALPFSNGSANGEIGRITSNSAGTASAEVQAICLK